MSIWYGGEGIPIDCFLHSCLFKFYISFFLSNIFVMYLRNSFTYVIPIQQSDIFVKSFSVIYYSRTPVTFPISNNSCYSFSYRSIGNLLIGHKYICLNIWLTILKFTNLIRHVIFNASRISWCEIMKYLLISKSIKCAIFTTTWDKDPAFPYHSHILCFSVSQQSSLYSLVFVMVIMAVCGIIFKLYTYIFPCKIPLISILVIAV